MNKVIKTQFALAVLAILTCGLASAQQEALHGTYLDTGYYNSGLPIPASQWTAVGSVVDVSCPGTTDCTIEAIHSIQAAGRSSPAENEFDIDFYLDGVLVGAQQVGEIPTDGSFRVFSAIEVQRSVSPGAHKVQTAVYAVDGSTAVYNYQTSYQVYKP
jgi:hypothetical protein